MGVKVYTPSGIPYSWMIVPELYGEQFARNANQIVMQLKCLWEDAGDLKSDLMESCVYKPGQSWLIRTTPYRHPETDNAYLVNMTKYKLFLESQPSVLPGIAGFGYPTPTYDEKTGLYSFDYISYNCVFGNLPYPVLEDSDVKTLPIPELSRYATMQPKPETLNRRLSTHPLEMTRSDGSTVAAQNEVGTIPETTMVLQIKQWMWPKAAINWPAIRACSGFVNSVGLSFFGDTHSTETLRYDGLMASPEEYTGPDGNKYVDLVHRAVRHPVNWNKTYDLGDPAGPQWNYFSITGLPGGPRRRYPSADLSAVFKPL